MGKPIISVVITAYNRRKYLKYAIKSVLNQTIDRSKYEIIVIKNFKDPVVDNLVERNHGKVIDMDIMSIGAKFAKGIEESEGEIVAFLEDDDLWYSRKLAQTLKEFTKDDNLIYYHHNVYVINENGQLIRDKLIEESNINKYIKALTEQEKIALFKEYGWGPGLRMSSIAIRRDSYIKYTSVIKLLPDVVDVAIYLLSLAIPGTLMHAPQKLTFYRIHSQSSSSVRFTKGKERLIMAIKNSIRHAVARHGLIVMARNLTPDISKYVTYDEASIVGGIFANWRLYTAVMAVNLLKLCKSSNCVAAAILGTMNTLSPTLTKMILTKYYER